MKPTPSDIVAHVAVDPAARCGLAWRIGAGPVHFRECFADKFGGFLAELRDVHGVTFVVATVERVETRWVKARAHRATANQVEAAIRRDFPRRNQIWLVDPQRWQRAMIAGLPVDPQAKNPTKLASIASATLLLRKEGSDAVIESDNAADAVNILGYMEKTLIPAWEAENSAGGGKADREAREILAQMAPRRRRGRRR